jgi:hypothetical protein
MISNWINFLESVKIKGLKKARKKEGMFDDIHIELKEGGRNLKEVMTKVAEELGIKGTLKAHKAGSFGITFLWGNKTLKVTTARSEAEMISKIIEKQERLDIKSIIKYEQVYELKLFKKSKQSKYEDEGYFVILMEQVRPLELSECQDVCHFYERYLEDYFNFNDTEREVQKKKRMLVNQIKKTEYADFDNYVEDMVNIIKDYKKLGMDNNDIHSGNLGISDDGRLVSFDPMGISKKSKDIKIKKLKI